VRPPKRFGRVYGSAATAPLVCESLVPFGLALRLVEKQHFCHCAPVLSLGATAYERDMGQCSGMTLSRFGVRRVDQLLSLRWLGLGVQRARPSVVRS
jgi:hypothetical protein